MAGLRMKIDFILLFDRGHVLEAIVSRLKMLGCRARFLAVSATFPNVEDVAYWDGFLNV